MLRDPGGERSVWAHPAGRIFDRALVPDVLQRNRRALHAASAQRSDDVRSCGVAHRELAALAVAGRRLDGHAALAGCASDGGSPAVLLSARAAAGCLAGWLP